jgi:predicted dienelactone hydrolase
MIRKPAQTDSSSPVTRPKNRRGVLFYLKRGLTGLLVLVITVVVIVVIAWARGLIRYPALSGPYPVGTVDVHLTDKSRAEIFTEAPDDRRELMVTLYYPANPPSGAQTAPFAEGLMRDAFAARFGTPGFLQDSVRRNAYAAVPVAKDKASYPVILFSPGAGFVPLIYGPTLEDLASHGYIVVAVSRPYSDSFTVFPDGRVIRSIPEAGSKALSDAAALSTSAAEFEPIINRIGDVWVADNQFVLDQLAEMNRTDERFAGLLDLERVGIFGHSFGGGVAAATLYQDDRFDAGLNMDGTFFGKAAHNGLSRPFMLMLSERVPVTPAQIAASGSTAEAYAFTQEWESSTQQAMYETATPGYRLVLQGSTHHTFITFEPVASPVLMIPTEMVGTIPGERAVKIVNDYVSAFFDQYLKGNASPLLANDAAKYPEAVFERNEK